MDCSPQYVLLLCLCDVFCFKKLKVKGEREKEKGKHHGHLDWTRWTQLAGHNIWIDGHHLTLLVLFFSKQFIF